MDFDAHRHGLEYLEYYSKHNVYHPGWDLNKGYGNDDLNAPGYAIMNGEVEYVSPKGDNGGLGLYCVLYFPSEGKWVRILHLNDFYLKAGDNFKEGDLIMRVGKSGTNYAHMHIEGWNKIMFDYQEKYWKRKFGYYPSGQSKAWVQARTFDVLAWIQEENEREKKKAEELASVPEWAQEGSKHSQKTGLINQITGRTLKDYELATILYRFEQRLDAKYKK